MKSSQTTPSLGSADIWLKHIITGTDSICCISVSVQTHRSCLTKHSSALKLFSSNQCLLRSVCISASVPHCTNGEERRRFLSKDRRTLEQSLYIWTEAMHWGRIRSLTAVSISLLVSACQHQHKESSLLDRATGSTDTECREREGTVVACEREKVTQCD